MTQTLFKDISTDAGLQYNNIKTMPDSCDASDSCIVPAAEVATKVAGMLKDVLKCRRTASSNMRHGREESVSDNNTASSAENTSSDRRVNRRPVVATKKTNH